MMIFSSLAQANTLSTGGCCFLGDRQIQSNPAAQRMRSGGFEKYFESAGRELFGQVIQRIQRRFAAGNDDRLRRERAGAFDDRIDFHGREKPGIPRHFRVAPPASDVASAQSDKIGRFSGMETFSLNGVKIFDERQFSSAAEQVVVVIHGRRRFHKCLCSCVPVGRSRARNQR